MQQKIADNLARFFYDCGKVTFAVLVIGVLTKKPFALGDLVFGLALTLTLMLAGVMIDWFKEGE